jgi:protein O-mannosyl-transferase
MVVIVVRNRDFGLLRSGPILWQSCRKQFLTMGQAAATSISLATVTRCRLWLAGVIIGLAGFIAYRGSIDVPFMFEDQLAITENQTIRDPWNIREVLNAATPNGSGVRGRPLINLSMAFNYAVGGLNVRGYHAFNIGVHLLAGLILFGLVRRTFEGERCHAWLTGGGSSIRCPPRKPGKCLSCVDDAAFIPAFVVALLWTLHPLQTESVICPTQRTESLMGLCYFLTLYLFVRGVASVRPARWFAGSVVVCFAGMACKEVMVSAPLMVLLYDKTFLGGSFREAWSRRRSLYICLFGSWVLLALLLLHSGGQRGGTVGFGLGVSVWHYALTQCHAVLLYLRLSVWPYPLIGDYGTAVVANPSEVIPQAIGLAALVVGTAIALVKRPVPGFAGVWFFAILAPSSSILPLASQTIAEHRMYLPLAAVIALEVALVSRVCGRSGMIAFLALAAAFAVLSIRRADAYRSEFVFWSEVVVRKPDNPRAHYNLGCLLVRAGREQEGMRHIEEAVRLRPDFTEAHVNLGHGLNRAGRLAEAIHHYEEALRLKPNHVLARYALAETFERLGNNAAAINEYRKVVSLRPDFADPHSRLAGLLLAAGRIDDAIAEYGQVLRLQPNDLAARAGIDRAHASQAVAAVH